MQGSVAVIVVTTVADENVSEVTQAEMLTDKDFLSFPLSILYSMSFLNFWGF